VLANQGSESKSANGSSYQIALDRPMITLKPGKSASGRLFRKCPREWFMALVALRRRCFVASFLKLNAKEICKTIKYRAACFHACCPLFLTSTRCLIIGNGALWQTGYAPKKKFQPPILGFPSTSPLRERTPSSAHRLKSEPRYAALSFETPSNSQSISVSG
jgi:hypothetical protein